MNKSGDIAAGIFLKKAKIVNGFLLPSCPKPDILWVARSLALVPTAAILFEKARKRAKIVQAAQPLLRAGR